MEWAELVELRNLNGCRNVLSRDVSATAAFMAASLLVADPFSLENPLFEEGDLLDYDSLYAVIQAKAPDLDDDNIHRIFGLVTASSEDIFFTNPDHFSRLCGAIVYGDPFRYENEDPELVELVWAIFQVDMILEESADDLLSPAVAARIVEITEDNPDDEEILADIEPEFAGAVDEFYDALLRFRKVALVEDLRKCGLTDEAIVEMGVELD